MRQRDNLSFAGRLIAVGLVSGLLLCANVAPRPAPVRASAQDWDHVQLPAEDGVVPAPRQRLKAGTKLRGKCQPEAPYPKGDNIESGTKYHSDSTESEFFLLDADGKPGAHVGRARWSVQTPEEIKNDTPHCHTTRNGSDPLAPLAAGRYRMTVTHTVYDSTYYNISSWSAPENKKETTEDVDFEIVAGCADDASEGADAHDCRLNSATLRAAFEQALNARQLETPPCYVAVQAKDPQLADYQVRLGKDYNLLPTSDWIKTQTDEGHLNAPQEGSRYMLQGAAQKAGDTYRVTIRVVNLETGVVASAAKGDAAGCPEGLGRALDAALKNLNAPLRPYAPR
jgi:hypothetical protein